MFEYLKGILLEKAPTYAVLDVHGIGYRLSIPFGAYSSLPSLEENVIFFTTFIVREDGHYLYGFLNKQDRSRFEALITVSGIGPKLALTVVGHLDQESFLTAIQTSNIKLISKIPGIGKKTAERLILEMKDKMKVFLTSHDHPQNSLSIDCINALVNLGYHPMKAQKAVQSVLKNETDADIGSVITKALKFL